MLAKGLGLRIGDDFVSRMTRVQLTRLFNHLKAAGINARLLISDKPQKWSSPVSVTNLETGAVRIVDDFQVYGNGFIEIPPGSNAEKVLEFLKSLGKE